MLSSLSRRVRLLPVVLVAASCTQAAGPTASVPSVCAISEEALGRFVALPTGRFVKGAAPIYPEEYPTSQKQVAGFEIQVHEVTRSQFAAFVDATGYVTDVEQDITAHRPDSGSALFAHGTDVDSDEQGWSLAKDATWQRPAYLDLDPTQVGLFPVVHVSKRDAEAYAEWAGGRLPSEVEWEYAATIGLPDPTDPVSGAYQDADPRANTWQGVFPITDLGRDGFRGVAPVGCFPADTQGLYDMIGNVWEWTNTPYTQATHTIKGGSFLCADNFCRRYRPSARQPQETNFSSNHIGFRIVRDLPAKASED